MLRTVAPGIPLAFVVALSGLFFYTLLNITFAAAMDVAGSKLQATSYGLSSLMMQLATSPTPIVAGWLIGKYGIGSAFALAGFFNPYRRLTAVALKTISRDASHIRTH